MSEQLNIRLGEGDGPLDFALVEQLSEHLRGVYREIARELGAEGRIQVAFHLRDASKGSLNLVLEPHIEGDNVPEVALVSQTLIEDINRVGDANLRPTAGSNLVAKYRALLQVAERANGLVFEQGGNIAAISSGKFTSFEASLAEDPEPDTVVVGTIETVNIHRRPWTFGLYQKLDRQRVECVFDEPMLQTVLDLMESKALVEVTGEGKFGPVGITPRLLEVLATPKALVFDPDFLLSLPGTLNLAEEGETASDVVERNRLESRIVA